MSALEGLRKEMRQLAQEAEISPVRITLADLPPPPEVVPLIDRRHAFRYLYSEETGGLPVFRMEVVS